MWDDGSVVGIRRERKSGGRTYHTYHCIAEYQILISGWLSGMRVHVCDVPTLNPRSFGCASKSGQETCSCVFPFGGETRVRYTRIMAGLTAQHSMKLSPDTGSLMIL